MLCNIQNAQSFVYLKAVNVYELDPSHYSKTFINKTSCHHVCKAHIFFHLCLTVILHFIEEKNTLIIHIYINNLQLITYGP